MRVLSVSIRPPPRPTPHSRPNATPLPMYVVRKVWQAPDPKPVCSWLPRRAVQHGAALEESVESTVCPVQLLRSVLKVQLLRRVSKAQPLEKRVESAALEKSVESTHSVFSAALEKRVENAALEKSVESTKVYRGLVTRTDVAA
eukprot:360056-Chlamydomonas_euryale.AAC.15